MDTATIQQAAAGRREAGYVAVPVDTLKCLSVAPVDVFVQSDAGHKPSLYCRAGYPLASTQFLGLADAGVTTVHLQAEDVRSFGAQLLESVQPLLKDDRVPHADRFAALQLAVSMEIEHAARLVDCAKYVSLAERIGRDLTSLLAANDVLPRALFGIARHDFHTFTHVTNVASYSVVLAEKMGICDRDELDQIAIAAMLHDIGKRFIPACILTKPARLDKAEREIIETHPLRGFEELQDRPDLTFSQLMIVYQHHERIDGTGYPVGIKGDDIHPWARLLAVVDVFDAMTGNRPYRRPAPAAAALDYIGQNLGTHFDPEIASCWISAMNEA
jgi:HD-GYP domain-containing protein (c-di-GMP phosphodiesterase class II)